MQKKAKNQNSSLGAEMGCPSFSLCPLCYGCRNYTTSNVECELCIENKKFNICNTELHKTDKIPMFITKQNIKL